MSQVPICPTHNRPMFPDHTQLTTPLVCEECKHEGYLLSLQNPYSSLPPGETPQVDLTERLKTGIAKFSSGVDSKYWSEPLRLLQDTASEIATLIKLNTDMAAQFTKDRDTLHSYMCQAEARAESAEAEILRLRSALDAQGWRQPIDARGAADNVVAWKLAEALNRAMTVRAGDPIDRGLAVLRVFREAGFGIVALPAPPTARPEER